MNYRAIIFDLDGTAIPNHAKGMPSKHLIDQIRLHKNKIHLCAATGRPLANAKYIIEALGLIDPCIISAGTQIYDPAADKIIWEASLEQGDAEKILTICNDYHYEVLTGNELLGEGLPASKRPPILGQVNVLYIMQCSIPDSENILRELAKIPTITASGVKSWTNEGVDIHITHKQATKEHAVHELLKILGLRKEEVIGVGDGDNDIHLFAAVGTSIAMGNATEKLKSLANEITLTVDDDGLAEVIKKYS